jgi:hypothetical protein
MLQGGQTPVGLRCLPVLLLLASRLSRFHLLRQRGVRLSNVQGAEVCRCTQGRGIKPPLEIVPVVKLQGGEDIFQPGIGGGDVGGNGDRGLQISFSGQVEPAVWQCLKRHWSGVGSGQTG